MDNGKKKFTLPHQYLWQACGRVAEYGYSWQKKKDPEKIKKNQRVRYRKCLRDMKYLEDLVWVDQKFCSDKKWK